MHAFFARPVADHRDRRVFVDQIADRLRHHQKFADRLPALVPGAVADIAALAVVEFVIADFGAVDREPPQVFVGRDIAGLALRADAADQPLGEDRRQRRTDQERLDAHIDQSGDGAGGVVGVQRTEHEVPGQRRFDGDLRGLEVADLAHEDAIRVLPQEGAERFVEGHAHGVVHLHLHDAFDVVLHRVFGGQELVADHVDLAQRRVERGGLAGTGRARHQQNAVRQVDDLAEFLQEFRIHAEGVEVKVHHAAVEHAEHHRFAVAGRQTRNAEVDRAAVELHFDTAVLRAPPFRDVQPGDDLDAADDRQRQILRRLRHFVQRAVHAVADAEFVFERFEVDVGGFVADRLLHHHFHELDHRRLVGHVFQLADGIIGFRLGLLQRFDQVADVLRFLGVVAFQLGIEGVRIADHRMHRLAEDELQRFDALEIQRVPHGQMEHVVLDGDRDDLVGAGGFVVDLLQHFLRELAALGGFPDVGIEAARHHLQDLAAAEEAEVLDHLHRRLPGARDFFRHFLQGIGQPRLGVAAFVQQKLDQSRIPGIFHIRAVSD